MAPEHASDDVRRAAGFRTVAEVEALLPRVLVLDPGSVLIGIGVRVADGVVLYPGTVLETRGAGTIEIGSEARIGPGPVSVLADGGAVVIDGGAQLGPGAVTVTTIPGADVSVGSGARVFGGASVEGPATIGAGAQVLGAVAVRDVVLEGGGTHAEPDPDRRAAVVKGTGRVHGVRLRVGEVVVAGAASAVVERQRAHHPGAHSRDIGPS
jgi:carbonic anhydrase/acetyltransferase-like protein (isoleucine patch superfamily)